LKDDSEGMTVMLTGDGSMKIKSEKLYLKYTEREGKEKRSQTK